jgi:hypothetical protein
MTRAEAVKKTRARRETAIEDAVMTHPDALGFPGALSIRNCRVSLPTGRVDVVLLPRTGSVRLVLVEAKAAVAQDAASKVVGQLLMYYAGALMLGSEGVRALQEFAVKYPEQAQSTSWISPKMLSGGVSPPPKAFEALYQGRRLTPKEVHLFVALDGEAHRALEPTLLALREHHGLHIGFVLVRGGKIERVSRPDSG